MRRLIIVAALFTVLGGVVGAGIFRSMAQREQLPHAVMWLMGNHFKNLKAAVKTGTCQSEAGDWQGVRFLQGEIPQAFAKLHQENSDFRLRAAALNTALEANQSAAADCAALDHKVKAVGEACEACHKKFG
jgi:cytochrome c556